MRMVDSEVEKATLDWLESIAWPNGADLDPLILYARVTGQPLPTEKRPVTV